VTNDRPRRKRTSFSPSFDRRWRVLRTGNSKNNRKETVARIGRSPEHMARMRARRQPFSDPRAGRLLRAIEFAFLLSRGAPISTTALLKSCYPVEHMRGRLKSWHRSNVVRAARRVAGPIGRASTRGRPLVWRAILERMKARALFLGAGGIMTSPKN
jgi:hypothetical protein